MSENLNALHLAQQAAEKAQARHRLREFSSDPTPEQISHVMRYLASRTSEKKAASSRANGRRHVRTVWQYADMRVDAIGHWAWSRWHTLRPTGNIVVGDDNDGFRKWRKKKFKKQKLNLSKTCNAGFMRGPEGIWKKKITEGSTGKPKKD